MFVIAAFERTVDVWLLHLWKSADFLLLSNN